MSDLFVVAIEEQAIGMADPMYEYIWPTLLLEMTWFCVVLYRSSSCRIKRSSRRSSKFAIFCGHVMYWLCNLVLALLPVATSLLSSSLLAIVDSLVHF